MKSALALTVIVCLVASAIPVTAQQPTETPGSFDLRAASPVTVGLLTRAVTREAVRLPAAGEPTAGEVVQQTGKPVEANWSRVRKLASGRAIVVTVKESPPAQRHFVAGDEADLTVVNLTDPTLPAAARDVLRDMAANHPDYFAVADEQTFVNGTVRAGFACQAAVGRDRCDTGAFLTGALVGGIAGGIYGFRAANRETEDVVYRAP